MKHFLDIGANEGQTFDYLATLDKSYADHLFWVFEPSPRHYAKLLRKCHALGDRFRINVCSFGLSDVTRIARFYEKDDAMGDSFLAKHASDHVPENITNGYKIYSTTMSIADFIISFTSQSDEIVLDIDVEGSEYAIVSALLHNPRALVRVREVMIEWHNVFSNKRDLINDFICVCEARHIKLTHRGLVTA